MATHNARRKIRGLGRRTPALLVIVVTVLLSLLALVHPGVTTTEVDVDDGGIWVTNASKHLVGHLNYDSRTLDGALRTDTADFDLGQTADVVTLADKSTHSLTPIDVATVGLGTATSLPEGAAAVQGGTRVGVLDPAEGNLWVANAVSPSSTSYTAETAKATDVVGGVVTVSPSGTVFAASATSGRLTGIQADGEIERTTTENLEGVGHDAELSITTVGEHPVLLDSKTLTLRLPDGTMRDLSKDGLSSDVVLQEPGPEADSVVLASGTALVEVPFNGSQARVTGATDSGASGKPARPVVHRGCTYGAWAGSGAYLRNCADPSANAAMVVDTLKAATEPRFRTNRTRIVLNDVRGGAVWLPEENMVLMNDWDEIENQLDEKEKKEDNPDVTEEISDPETREKNSPPEAQDDVFGVRPGRTATLPVLANDNDPDGDVLTARPVTSPAIGTVAQTRGGRALQLNDVPDQGGATTTFTYEASDGQAVDTASVTVEVHGWDMNSAPEQQRDARIKLGANAQIEYNVLPDWLDPDGDPIYLSDAQAPEGIDVQFREEGTLVIRDLGATPGVQSIGLTVSDGTAEGTGTLSVLLQSPGNIAPVANADFYVARKGEPLTLEPLANDWDPNGDSLRLAAVASAPAGTTLTPDLDLSAITFLSQTPGSYQFTYTVTDGPTTVRGMIRVNVVDATAEAEPVAEDDLVVLPAGGSALAAPLNNDTDPGGGVLVIQQVGIEAAKGIEVTLVDRHLLRITAPSGLDGPVSFPYTVSNGSKTATALVTVVPTKALDAKKPPVLTADSLKVRVGDVGSVAVLANDRSPAGLALKVDTKLVYEAAPEVGTPFVTGNLVRIEAGTKPGVIHVGYTVHDSAGNSASSTVTFQVLGLEGTNAQPQPKPLTAWAASGETARIPVPLHGIDPDGDSVTLVGIEQSPTKGTVTLGVDWLEYTPSSGAVGTDVFTYIVEDRRGKQATARVRVGIAPPASFNQSPVAVPDTVLAKPNRRLAVPVLVNDIDADGDPITLEEKLETNDPALAPRVNGSTVVMTTPPTPGTRIVSYTISDGRGGVGRGTLTINVSQDAVLQPPTARDDVVSVSDLPDDGTAVHVSVLDNDEDPDGDASELLVSTNAGGVKVDGKELVIVPEATRRLVVYTVTDPDGLTSSAVVSVAGLDRTRPVIDETRVPVEVRAGEDVTLDVTDYVLVRAGRSPRIVNGATIKASTGVDPGAKLVDPTHVSFHVNKEYAGRSSISFEVRDGSADDDSALSAVLTIPLVVRSTKNLPPILSPTPINVAPGEEAVASDLSLMVKDPDGADPTGFTYAMAKAPEGVVVSLNGYTLSVKAGVDRPKGPVGTVTVTVDDGSGAVSTEIPITIISSTRRLIQVSDAVVEAAKAGEPQTIDLASYTINPFPETPIRILGATVQQGQGSADPQGTALTITPAASYRGDMIVTYRLMDATGDPDRIVEGRVRLAVKDRPDSPSIGDVVSPAPGQALVNFVPGRDNNSPITSYTVSAEPGGVNTTCEGGPCLVSGLANGTTYTFRVRATNAIGDSDWSGPSAGVLVDVKPGQVSGVNATPGDSSAKLTWATPENAGSPITGYIITVIGGGTPEIKVGPVNAWTVPGLVNGTAYAFTVKAVNTHPEPGLESAPSAQVIPFGTPPAPTLGTPRIEVANADGDVVNVVASWSLGNPNGPAWDGVEVKVGDQVEAVSPSETSRTIQTSASEQVKVSVRARNRELWSEWATTQVVAKGIPSPPKVSSVEATGQHGQVAVDAQVVPGRGYKASELFIEYSTDNSSWQRLSGSTAQTNIDGEQTIYFRQSNGSVAGGTVSATADVYGPLGDASLDVRSNTDGTLTVDWKADNGAPFAPAPLVTFTASHGTLSLTQAQGTNGTLTISNAPSNTEITVYMTVTGMKGTTKNVEGRAKTPPANGEARAGVRACTPEEIPAGEDPAKPCFKLLVSSGGWEEAPTLNCVATDARAGQKVPFTVSANQPDQDTPVYLGGNEQIHLDQAELTCVRP